MAQRAALPIVVPTSSAAGDRGSKLCEGVGHCQPIGGCGFCVGGDVCKVCGCDGNTYPDIQTACRAGARVTHMGGGCGDTVQLGGGSGGGPSRQATLCGSDANCPADQLCCGITGMCFPASDPMQCRTAPEGTRAPCTSDRQCLPSEYCFGPGCNAPGGCVPLNSQGDCGVTLEPVCGCDGTTYTSAACASSVGVRVSTEGECAGAGN